MAEGNLNNPSEIVDYSSQVTASGTYYNTFGLFKTGRVKVIYLAIYLANTQIPYNVETEIATIPEGCRPSSVRSITVYIDPSRYFTLKIYASGSVRVINPIENQKLNGAHTIIYI